ncbi:hypothetical protein QET40_07250 [Akkermansia sp. N21169]|uniref:hypothetical protein n=1 Tax=Akkermansia sp. N21169 TaxID=3040765 RepID=UPI00244EAE2D|nr:hypothetical protein [Akkermansia sp. N21169]MDH3068907.1 hypothetical protein [Akkermansia sp. N21169]
MRTSPFILTAAGICMVSASVQAAETMKSVLSELADTLAALNTQLDTIKDKDSATAAAPEIEKIATKFAALTVKMMKPDNLTPPALEESADLQALQKRMMDINTKFQDNLSRIGQGGFITPELAKAFQALQPKDPSAAPSPAPAAGDKEEEKTDK